MALSHERIEDLKGTIRSYLAKVNVQAKLQNALSEGTSKADVESDVLNGLEETGVIDEIIDQFTTAHIPSKRKRIQTSGDTAAAVTYLRRQMVLHILKGKAFTAHLLDQPPLMGRPGPTYTLHVSFRGQRFRSKPTPCTEDPDLIESFLLELHRDGEEHMLDGSDLLAISDSIHFVLTKTDPNSEATLVSSQYLDWRSVLSSPNGKETVSVVMKGVGTENNVPTGIIDVSLEIVPQCQVVLEEVIATQTTLEKARQAERDRLFLIYTKRWWAEYLQVRSNHGNRFVKLFAQDENLVNRPVCSYVQLLRAGRLLENPRQAARFVSLIKFDKAATVGTSSKTEQWASLHAFLAANKGDVENHATLLCSLLLGYGLNAFVCLGTKNKGSSHAWVVTIGIDDGVCTFWESLNGNRYIHKHTLAENMLTKPPPVPKHPYRTVGCVFNHKSFFANMQTSDAVEFTSFDLDDEALWKAIPSDVITSVCGPTVSWMAMPPLQRPLYDPCSLSNSMEIELRHMIVDYRRETGLSTVFDDQGCYMLSMALSAYEMERITGEPYGNEEFSQAVVASVPEGQTFKAYPIHFPYANARRAFASALKSKTCTDIISCRGDNTRMAVRVCVYAYPESAVATWIMFACKYRPVL